LYPKKKVANLSTASKDLPSLKQTKTNLKGWLPNSVTNHNHQPYIPNRKQRKNLNCTVS